MSILYQHLIHVLSPTFLHSKFAYIYFFPLVDRHLYCIIYHRYNKMQQNDLILSDNKIWR